jgi:hypothetical protein
MAARCNGPFARHRCYSSPAYGGHTLAGSFQKQRRLFGGGGRQPSAALGGGPQRAAHGGVTGR